MKLFESHNPGHKFNKLTQVNFIYFLSFLIEFFLFRTHNFFNLFSMRLFQFHNLSRGFGRLTRIDLVHLLGLL